ncbi:hypothetical protein [Streptomyces niveus]|uniref:hypothetical protein n=1 Tax=Streptomyces niveus TaxID=193462 RepID=UPI00378CD64B
MTATEAAAALEEALLQQHIDRDREDLAGDERGPAEVGEWERIAQLLAKTGGAYDCQSDAVVQDELAAEAAAAAEAEEELRDLEMELERQERLHSILESRGMNPPKSPDAVPASVRAHSTLLRATARTGTLEDFDPGHAVPGPSRSGRVLALAAWIKARGRSSR